MKKKFLGRVLTMLLVASMVFTLLPASAVAAGNWWWNADEYTEEAIPTATADNSYQYNIFFLDCGRKYFSVDSIKTLIDNASAAGFNYIQLAVGNDGLRLLLDDMALTVGDNTYKSDDVKAAIHTGNLAYNAGIVKDNNHEAYNPETNELTQFEMDTIIAYANTKGMGVIPCVNTPGHMDAILSAATSLTKTTCAYNSSKTTIDVTNTTATAFTKALLQKYITYFKSQGCQLFNMGADEYANDVYKTGGMGFAHLKDWGQYVYYVNYINAVATMIKDAGMTPMAFNDGIYYGGDTSTAINKSIVICYWSSGWSGYEVRSAKNLVNDGFAMINTHGDYYYVLGKSDKYDEFGTSYASRFNRYNFIDGSTIQQPVGSMLCVWCDYPGDEDEATILSNTPDIIKNFGSTLPKLNTTPVQPDTGITIKPEGGTTGTTGKLDSTKNESIVLDAGKVVTWSYDPTLVTLKSADAASDVALADFATLSARRVTVTPVAGASGKATITAADENGHRADFPIEVVNSSATTGETVELKVGDTSDKYAVKGNVTDTDMKLASNFKDVASYDLSYRTETPVTVNTVSSPVGEEVYIKDETGKKYLDNTATWTPDVDEAAKWRCGKTEGGMFTSSYIFLELVGSSPKNYLSHAGSGQWKVTDSTYYRAHLAFDNTSEKFTVTEGLINPTTYTLGTPVQIFHGSPTAYTDITFTGVGEGDTSVTIGGTPYTIKVRYNEEPVNVVLKQSTQVPVSGDLNKKELNESVATVSISTDGTTMTVNGVAEGHTSVIVGNTRYNITVSTENLETVPPLKIEYWITNGRATGANSENNFIEITAVEANNKEGVATVDLVEGTAKKEGRDLRYWQTKLLDITKENNSTSSTELQTEESGDDETLNGKAFTKVRYWESKWQVFTTEWVDVDRTNQTVSYTIKEVTKTYEGEKNQLVAYYMEIVDIKNENDVNELRVNAADWGIKGDNSSYLSYYPQDGQCAVAIQIVYEDNSTNPADTSAANLKSKTLLYGAWSPNRGIGTMVFTGENNYNIYKVTAETGTMTCKVSNSGTYQQPKCSTEVTSFTWDNNAKTVWGADDAEPQKMASIGNPARNPDDQSPKDHLLWNKENDAILLRVYVVAEKNEDSLTVHYLDQGDENHEFYSYNITVNKGTYFNEEFELVKETNPKNNRLINHTVTNSSGQTQKAEINLLNVNAPAKYRYANFTCVNATRGEGGKDVYLYYTFDNSVSFIADFGLPLTIKAKDLSDAFEDGNQVTNKVVNDAPKHGTAVFDGINIVYTPGNTFPSSSGDTFTVTYTGTNPKTGEVGSASFVIYIYPASNVLYEASFLTQGSKGNGPEWTAPTATTTRKQQTQKVGDTTTNYHVFGRDEAYDNAYGALGAWTASGLNSKSSTGALTTSFYGNGFDLIGNCGPKTGRVILFVENAKTGKGKLVDVDTRYGADTFYQVPLAHVMMAEEASYNVTVYAAGLKATNATPASYSLRGAATYASDYAADSYDAVLNGVLAENGLTMADVEYVKVESAPAAAKTARRATSFYALDTAADTGSVTHEAGDHVEIDGFRVYRSTDNANNTNYPEGEKNVQYLNILDAVSSFTAFVEGSGSDVDWTVRTDYENAGGPQNEIYLRKTDGTGSAIAFKVDPNAIVQISARAVENGKPATLVVNDKTIVIATNTEMYYTYTAGANGIVTIKNTGEGMLALGNLKIKNGTQPAALSEEDYPMAIALLSLNAAPETPDTVFEPTISAKVTTTRFIRSKVVTLTVSASADVAKLTVNGKELRPTNGWLVSMGWSKSYNYILTETMKKSETKNYEIIGYSADGTASTPTIVTSK